MKIYYANITKRACGSECLLEYLDGINRLMIRFSSSILRCHKLYESSSNSRRRLNMRGKQSQWEVKSHRAIGNNWVIKNHGISNGKPFIHCDSSQIILKGIRNQLKSETRVRAFWRYRNVWHYPVVVGGHPREGVRKTSGTNVSSVRNDSGKFAVALEWPARISEDQLLVIRFVIIRRSYPAHAPWPILVNVQSCVSFLPTIVCMHCSVEIVLNVTTCRCSGYAKRL